MRLSSYKEKTYQQLLQRYLRRFNIINKLNCKNIILFILLFLITILIIIILTILNNTNNIPNINLKYSERQQMTKMKLEAINKYNDYGNNETIFIGICSYRDIQCIHTILNLFETALYPDRLRIGIFQQNNITDLDCTNFYEIINCDPLTSNFIHPICGRQSQIKIARIHYLDAKGPMYGRYRTELFYNNENYAMQIDSHSRMIPCWDNILISMFKKLNNQYAVISTYPKGVQSLNVSIWEPKVPDKYTGLYYILCMYLICMR